MLSIGDCGVMVEPQLGMGVEQLVAVSRRAEDLGFGYFFRSDHILPTSETRGIDSPECWTSLGAIAASTSRIRFGPLVSPVGFRNPALLARMACTLHSYAKGRLQLGVGAGWFEAEFRANGYQFPGFRQRAAQFQEALAIITAMVRGGRVDYDGSYFSAHTDCYPRPQGGLHLIVGAKTRSLVALAGRDADEWNYFRLPLEKFLTLKSALESSAGARRVEISVMTQYMIGRNQSDLEENARLHAAKLGQSRSPKEVIEHLRASGAPCGTADGFVQGLREFSDLGVSKVYFQTLVPENTKMIEVLADALRGL